MIMVLYQSSYTIDKDKVAEYTKWAKEESLPYYLSLPGVKEFRAYKIPGTLRILVEMDFDSFESWGKASDNPKTKEQQSKLASYTHDLEWTFWDILPLKPKK